MHARSTHFTPAILLPPLPVALLNGRISGSEMKLVNLHCFYDWLDMICIIIWTRLSFSLRCCLSPTYSLPPTHPFHYLDWRLWGKEGHRAFHNTHILHMYAHIQTTEASLQSLTSVCFASYCRSQISLNCLVSNFHLSMTTHGESLSEMWRL